MWFRNDLRTLDNTALFAATQKARVIALYTVTPEQWLRHDMAQIKIDFIRRNLSLLGENLAKLNIPLRIRRCTDYRSTAETVAEEARAHKVSTVFWNREYLLNEEERDLYCTSLLDHAGIHSEKCEDSLILPAGLVKSGSGEMYRVFTPFFRNWINQVQSFPPRTFPAPARQDSLNISSDPPEAAFQNIATTDSEHWPAGEAAAQRKLDQFIKNHLPRYSTRRDIPGEPGTSNLSPYLSLGILSARHCLQTAQKSSGGQEWIRQLAWRDFYNHLVHSHPEIVRGKAFQRKTDTIRWRQSPEDFQAWREGRTGQPFVDAGMRQLRQEGWMHNRLRMVTAMFLTKNLFIDWRLGEKHFMQHLVDGDFVLNNGGWQWSASTGTDAAPYFRIFNPFSQSLRFDPQGHFIKTYVPELAHLPATALHNPDKLRRQKPENYPELIVDLGQSRKNAIQVFSALSK